MVRPGCVFFFVGPFLLFFARAPCHWLFLEFLFAVGCRPRVCKVFFFGCAPLGAATFRRGQSQKNKTPSFAPAPAKGRERRSPVGRRHGARAKKNKHPGWCFFCAGPAERSRRPTGRNKKTLCTPGDDSKQNSRNQ